MKLKLTAGVVFAACAALAQPATGRLSFEVASVRVAEPINSKKLVEGKLQLGMQVEGLRVEIGFTSLSELIRQAYRLKSYQVTGPDWISSERYDIHAKMPEGSTKDQVPEMLQSLLADRFKLTFHHDSKEHQVYALTVGKNGPKLKEVEPDPPAPAGEGGGAAPTSFSSGFGVAGGGGGPVRVVGGDKGPAAGTASGEKAMVYSTKSGDGTTKMAMSGGGAGLHLDRKMTIPALCDFLTRFTDRPVVDMTNLTGTYQVVMDLPLESLMKAAQERGNVIIVNGGSAGPVAGAGSDTASDPSGGSAMFALVQQLGLKLEQRKAPMDILVADHVERTPTEN